MQNEERHSWISLERAALILGLDVPEVYELAAQGELRMYPANGAPDEWEYVHAGDACAVAGVRGSRTAKVAER